MKLFYYKNIIEKYYEIKARHCTLELIHAFPDISEEALSSIVFQEFQRKVKRSYHYHAAPYRLAKYYQKYLDQLEQSPKHYGFLVKIAEEADFSPALLAKLILEHYYKINPLPSSNGEASVTRNQIADMLKNPCLIPDANLAAEIRMCTLADESYGAISDMARSCVGIEYEEKLKQKLKELGLSFVDEQQLREKGYDKTPDVKLDLPIVVDGRVVNWIESKASFGDEERHREYLRDQYWSYCNRFGPGLVIYWCGFIEELNTFKDQGIIISDTFPENVTCMDSSLLVKDSDYFFKL